MTVKNGTRHDLRLGLPQLLNEFDELSDPGRENRALACFRRNTQEIAILRLAERVGVLDRDFAKPNGFNGLAIILAQPQRISVFRLSPAFCPFAGVCRFLYLNDTRNGTRVGRRGEIPPQNPTHDIYSVNSLRSHAFAIVHSRTTVAGEMPIAKAVSSIVKPPK